MVSGNCIYNYLFATTIKKGEFEDKMMKKSPYLLLPPAKTAKIHVSYLQIPYFSQVFRIQRGTKMWLTNKTKANRNATDSSLPCRSCCLQSNFQLSPDNGLPS